MRPASVLYACALTKWLCDFGGPNLPIAVAETDSKQLSGTKLEHFGNFSLGSKEAVNSQNPWRKMIMSSGKISSDLTTFNQLTLGKVKDGIIRTPALGKAF